MTTYHQFVEDFKTEESYQNLKKNPKAISKAAAGLMKQIEDAGTTLQEVMYAHAMENGVVMANAVGDRIYDGLMAAYDTEEDSEKKSLIKALLDHFRVNIDDPENTAIGNYACDELVKILKYHSAQIGVIPSIISVNINHEQRRKTSQFFTEKCPFESWKILRRGTVVLYKMQSGEYQFARVNMDVRIVNELMEVPCNISVDEQKIISVHWKDLIVVPAEVVDPVSFGGSLNGICKDCAAVEVNKILKEMDDFFIVRLKELLNIDIGFVNKRDALRRKHVTAIKEIYTKMKELDETALTDFNDEITETLRVKLSSLVDLIRRGVLPTYILLQHRTKMEIIRVDYREWAMKNYSYQLKKIDGLIKMLSKEKETVCNGTLIKEMQDWQDKVLNDGIMKVLNDNGYDDSVSLAASGQNIEGMNYNKFITEQVLMNINDPTIQRCIDEVVTEITTKLTHYLNRLRSVALSRIKVKDVKEMKDEEAIEQINNWIDINHADPISMALSDVVSEMKRVVDLLNPTAEGCKSIRDMFIGGINEIDLKLIDLIQRNQQQNKGTLDSFGFKLSGSDLPTDPGLSLAPHIKMRRWLNKQQMQN